MKDDIRILSAAALTLMITSTTPTYASYDDFSTNYEPEQKEEFVISCNTMYANDDNYYIDGDKFNYYFTKELVNYFKKKEVVKALDLYAEIYGKEFEKKDCCTSFLELIYEKISLNTELVISISDKAILSSFVKNGSNFKLQSYFNLPDTIFMSSCSKLFSINAMDCKSNDIEAIKAFIENV